MLECWNIQCVVYAVATVATAVLFCSYSTLIICYGLVISVWNCLLFTTMLRHHGMLQSMLL